MAGHGSNRPDSIIGDYLDELLSPGDDSPWAEEGDGGAPERRRARARRAQPSSRQLAEAERPVLNQALVSPVIRSLEQTPEDPPEPEPEPEPEPDVEALSEPDTLPEPERQQVVSEAVEAPSEPVAETGAWRNGRPPWAQEGFECLIFRVAGLQLAVPLVLLGQVHRLERELTPLFGRPDWFMGLLRVGGHTIRVADTARWVMPERYRDEFRDGYRFVIQLGDSAWGLACDDVAQSFHVQPDEVKWRSEGGRRQWLAGTIKKEMCALLDVSRMAALLQKAETERNPDLDR